MLTGKRKQNTYGKQSKEGKQGLPLLRTIVHNEKLTTSVSCKVWPSLAKWVRHKGGSHFLRGLLIVAKYEEEEKET